MFTYFGFSVLCSAFNMTCSKRRLEKETQKGKMKNTKVKKCKRCENVKHNNRIIQKMRKENPKDMKI